MSCRLAIGSADGSVHCDHARSSEDDCPGPPGCEADMTCVSKQRPQTNVACTRWSLYEGTLGVCNVRTEEHARSGMCRSGAVIGRAVVRVTLRGSQNVPTLHGLHVFN